MTINLDELKVPKDVKSDIGRTLELIGELKGTADEIIVITYLGRNVIDAFVCNVHKDYVFPDDDSMESVIYNIPNYPKLVVQKHMWNVAVKEINGIKYTMANLADKDLTAVAVSWLF